jgi:hypothetical protein
MLAVFVFGLSKLWDAIVPEGKCSHVVIDRFPSPDGYWVAVIDEYTCDVGSFSTIITDELHLVSIRYSLPDINLLGVDTNGNVSERPRVTWTAPNALQVTVPLEDYLRFRNRSVEGLQVDIRFDPDDPMVRTICREQAGRLREPVDNTIKQ